MTPDAVHVPERHARHAKLQHQLVGGHALGRDGVQELHRVVHLPSFPLCPVGAEAHKLLAWEERCHSGIQLVHLVVGAGQMRPVDHPLCVLPALLAVHAVDQVDQAWQVPLAGWQAPRAGQAQTLNSSNVLWLMPFPTSRRN